MTGRKRVEEQAPVVIQAPGPDSQDTQTTEQTEQPEQPQTEQEQDAPEPVREAEDQEQEPVDLHANLAEAVRAEAATAAQEAPEPGSDREVTPTTREHSISQHARAWLREAAAACGVDRMKANAMADWLEQNPDANIVMVADAPVPLPPLRIFGTPDVTPDVPRHESVEMAEVYNSTGRVSEETAAT